MSALLFLFRSAVAIVSLLSITALGCSDSTPVTQQERDLASLRQSVSGLHDLTAAEAAGYTTPVGDPTDGHTCLSDPAGGMGIHYLKTSLVNDTVIVTQPEILIYEPQQNGTLKFVGVEFIIPYTIHGADQPAPVLFGQAFSKNDHFQLWGLHAWVGKKNPSGTFAMWNPDVTCQFAPAQ
ncbi:MAG TPA: hypothetical protein VGO46_08620 [Gemmatimonadaceae bacterium]|jgi:hypothetical protein|nr:hypothetical protein [Gemmatimonadaceae bacterium]